MQSFLVECCNCGVQFWMTGYMESRRRNDHKTFYCPNGHPQSYHSKTAEEKEIARLKERNQTLEHTATTLRREMIERRYQCPIAHCRHTSDQKKRLRDHMEKFHNTAFGSKMLPANASKPAHGDMGITN